MNVRHDVYDYTVEIVRLVNFQLYKTIIVIHTLYMFASDVWRKNRSEFLDSLTDMLRHGRYKASTLIHCNDLVLLLCDMERIMELRQLGLSSRVHTV